MVRSIVLVLVLAAFLNAAPKKSPLPPTYTHWLKEEVTYIITDEEKKAFLNLETDLQRDKFITDFWDVRNPVRGGATNSYKDEHYRRLQYANDNFGRRSNTPGWNTDMGRAWILFGKPVSRAPYLGYGQLYPCELWFYENRNSGPSIPGYFTLLFFMPEDIGEFRFYRPSLDTPLKLVRGSQFNSNADVYKFLKPIAGDLAKAAFTLIPGDPIDTVNYTVDLSSDMMISKIQNFANDPFNLRKLREMRSLRISVDSTFLVAQDQPLTLDTFVARDLAGQSWLDFSVLIREASLGKIVTEGKQLSVISGFRLLTEGGELIAENQEERAYPAFGADGVFLPFQIAGRLPVLPGKYRLECTVADRANSRVFHGEKKFTVLPVEAVAISDPLFFSVASRVPKPDGLTPFQYFGAQFQPIPNLAIPGSEPLRFLYTIEVPSSQPQAFTVEYLVAHAQEHDSRLTIKDEIPFSEFRNGRLLKSKTIPLTGLIPGPYRVVMTVRAAQSQAVLSASTTAVRVGEAVSQPVLYFLESSRTTASPAGAAYIRALEAISFKDTAAALRFMQQAVELNPGNAGASQYLVEKWFETKQFRPVVTLYRRVGMKPFESSAESLAQISLSCARNGDKREAQDVLVAARALFPNNQILLAAAKAVAN